jgi:hypothetical protein
VSAACAAWLISSAAAAAQVPTPLWWCAPLRGFYPAVQNCPVPWQRSILPNQPQVRSTETIHCGTTRNPEEIAICREGGLGRRQAAKPSPAPKPVPAQAQKPAAATVVPTAAPPKSRPSEERAAASAPAEVPAAVAADGDQFIRVDLDDIAAGSGKYVGRDIQADAVHCWYADIGDYRCIQTIDGAVIFAARMEPDRAQTYIEKNCGTLRQALSSPLCLIDIRFRYDDDDLSRDVISGLRERTVIRLPSVAVVAHKP